MITPNEKEARFAIGDQDSTVDRLTKLVHENSNFKNIILKLGKRGVYSMHKTSVEEHKGYSIDSFADNVVDPVGSGDALLAYSTLSMLATKSLLLSSIIGSFAAAVACENNGNEPVLIGQLLKKISNVEKLAIQNNLMKKLFKYIVIGMGVQGLKRAKFDKNNFVGYVDPLNKKALYKSIFDVPLEKFSAAFVCTPDKVKIKIIDYLLKNKKHVLVEKPLFSKNNNSIKKLYSQAKKINLFFIQLIIIDSNH